MYEAYFGLRERPFSIAPDPRYFYLSPRHREALAHLLYGIHERGGFVQLTGEVGTGKTTITRTLLDQLPADVDIALILNPSVTVREFLVAICEELGISLPKRSFSTQALMDELTRYLLDAYGRGRHTVVLVDEAQNLSPQVIEQVRLLTNLETTREKLLQIILVGQPELRDLLARPELRQVAQRITARYHLVPLSFAETCQYIQHRCTVAGVARPLFTRAAMYAIHRRARGIPRLVNVICDRALLGAYASGRSQVNLRIALRAAREVGGSSGLKRFRYGIAAAMLASAAAIGAGAWALWPGDSGLISGAVARKQPAVAVTVNRSFGDRLASGELRSNADKAFEGLFRLWGQSYRPGPQTPCTQARTLGLRCFYESGSWEAVRARNLPAVIELRDGNGTRHRVLLRAIGNGEAVLQLGDSEERVPLGELARLWGKESVTLWKPPAAVRELILPGSRGSSVEWLVRQLDRIEGRLTVAQGAVYNDTLQERVRQFQRSRGIDADGLVGETTLMHLVIAAPDSDAPVLDRN